MLGGYNQGNWGNQNYGYGGGNDYYGQGYGGGYDYYGQGYGGGYDYSNYYNQGWGNYNQGYGGTPGYGQGAYCFLVELVFGVVVCKLLAYGWQFQLLRVRIYLDDEATLGFYWQAGCLTCVFSQ